MYYIKTIYFEFYFLFLNLINFSSFTLFLFSFYLFFVAYISFFLYFSYDFLFYLFSKKKFNFLNEPIYCYRIENKNGIGPYHHYPSLIENSSSVYKPTPYHDFKKEWLYIEFQDLKNSFYFGFPEFEDIFNWFTKNELNILYSNGFIINKYLINEYIKSKKQIVFNKSKSILIETISIME
jgi:hypothetical protein